ncbi:MAG: protein YgfX [Rhodanobacteraceae bacterium]
MKTAPAIGFRHRPSRLITAMMLAVALLALLAIWISGAPDWLRFVLSLLVAGYVGVAAKRQLRPRIRAVLWRADGGVELTFDGGRAGPVCEIQATITGTRVMGPLIVLALRWSPRGRATLWLLPDNLDFDTRRRLRMRLGAQAHAATVSGNADSG